MQMRLRSKLNLRDYALPRKNARRSIIRRCEASKLLCEVSCNLYPSAGFLNREKSEKTSTELNDSNRFEELDDGPADAVSDD